MAKVIVTAQVRNVDDWEKAFRTHGELFRKQGAMSSPVLYSLGKNGEVVVCSEVADPSTYINLLASPETVSAMEQDGVRLNTVKSYVLDKEFSF